YLPALLPAALHRQRTEHRRLARPCRRASRRALGLRGVPESAEHLDAAHLDRRGLRVLVLVDHVLVETLGHQLLGLRLHPGGPEGREVHTRVAVQHQLVVDDLVGDVGGHLALCERELRDVVALVGEDRCDRALARRLLRTGQRHRLAPANSRSGVNGCSSSCPGWTTPQDDSGTSFQAPGRSPSGSETTSLDSSSSPWSSSFSGYISRSVLTSVLKKRERDFPSLE